MNLLEPKKRLLQNKDQASFINDIVTSDRFKECLTIALVQMQMSLPSSVNISASWDNQNQMEGAKTFINILLNLGQIESNPIRTPIASLNPRPEMPSPNLNKPSTKKE